MYTINIFDSNTGNDPYANMHWPVPELQYIKPPVLEWDGITVFTDEFCFSPIVDQVRTNHKIAWAFESPVIKPQVYNNIKSVEHKFDYIYICNIPEDRKQNPKYIQSYFGACWIPEQHCRLYNKSKLLSIVASNKNIAPGHKLRHELISQNVHPELELWGSGYRYFKDDPLSRTYPFASYMYSIVIENCQYPNYFTDKIIDCFATGTIPIYWGNPNISKLFNNKGFYTWNTIDELKEILQKISIIDYNSRIPFIEDNYSRYKTYASPDKWMIDNCYKKIL